MKKIIILLFLLILNSCFFKKNNIKENKYPYLVESIETYFNQNYSYPKNMEELKCHIKERTSFDLLYKKLDGNDKVSLINSRNKIFIIDKSVKDTLAEVYKFDFCKRLKEKKFPRFYLEDWVMYRKGKTLQKNEIDSLRLKAIKQKIAVFSEQELAPYYRDYYFVRFVNDSLIFKCTQKERIVNKDSIKYFLKKFSLKNEVDSIYFFSSFKRS